MMGLVIAVLTIMVGTASHAFAAIDQFLNFNTVPEPSSLAVMAAGAGYLVFKLRKRK